MLRRCLWQRQKDTQALVQDFGKKLNALVVDYLRMSDTLGVKFHVPVLVGERHDGLRGLYLAGGHSVGRNEPVLTIPYRTFITPETLATAPEALTSITQESLRAAIKDEEFASIVPHIYMAIQLSQQMQRLPRNSHEVSEAAQRAATHQAQGIELTPAGKMVLEKYGELVEVFTGGLMPWCRMVDDLDWSEQHVQELYKPVLDQFQTSNYDDMILKFGRNMSHLHANSMLEMKLDDLRRLTRIIMARAEQVPLSSELRTPAWQRRFIRAYRLYRKEPLFKRTMAIIPVAELINHSGRPNVVMKFGIFDGEPAVRLQSVVPITGGSEICRHYNFALDRSNSLFRYGFLPFDIASVPQLDQWKAHYLNDVYPQLGEFTESEREEMNRVQTEVDKLQDVFRNRQRGDTKR